MLLKQKSPSFPRNLALGTFGKLLMVFSTKVNLLYFLYLTTWRCCLLHLIKQNYLLKAFLRTLILMALVSLYLFSLLELIWNNLHNISITSKMVKKVITNLDSLNVSGRGLYSSGASKELWAWTFVHTSWSLQSERVLFFRLLEGFIGGPCI